MRLNLYDKSLSIIYLLLTLAIGQIFQVAPSLHMVEVRKAKGDTLEFHKVRTLSSFDFHLYMYLCCYPLNVYTMLTILAGQYHIIK